MRPPAPTVVIIMPPSRWQRLRDAIVGVRVKREPMHRSVVALRYLLALGALGVVLATLMATCIAH